MASAPPGGNSTPKYDYNIVVDGNMYLDYSVFGGSLDSGGNIALSGHTIHIFSNDQTPTLPDPATLTIFKSLSLSMNESGNVLLFSDSPVLSGSFTATGDLAVGNFLPLVPVPLPSSNVFMLFAIMTLGVIVTLNKRHGVGAFYANELDCFPLA